MPPSYKQPNLENVEVTQGSGEPWVERVHSFQFESEDTVFYEVQVIESWLKDDLMPTSHWDYDHDYEPTQLLLEALECSPNDLLEWCKKEVLSSAY